VEDGTDRERAAILKVIEDECAAYFEKDYAGWARCWVHGAHVRRWAYFPPAGVVLNEGWEKESSEMRANMARFPARNLSVSDLRFERVTMRIGADMAWVTFDQHSPRTGDPFDVAGLTYQLRVLERHDGQWKIACVGILQSWLEHADWPVIRVDAEATILWLNATAGEQLRDHRGLGISAGRLRARGRTANKNLQASIRWASESTDWMSRQADAQARSWTSRGMLAVDLGEDEEAIPRVCWVIAESGMVLVSFDDRHTTERRLSAAAVVYRLSPCQARLAGLIVDGLDVAEAARQLGISANTARTHLQRMFDKTGARSQPALVRALLSIVSPVT
jgi:DNA-binding CsgD family transcriptional regulator